VEWRDGFPPEPHCTLAACISGHHSRCIFTVDWSSQGLIATGGLGANAVDAYGTIGPNNQVAACISGHHRRCIFAVDWSSQGLIATGGLGANPQ
jgi:hypothetical protein